MDDLFGDIAPTAPSSSKASSSSSSAPGVSASAASLEVDDQYESVIFVQRECYVYKLPPRQSNAGYKASEWGDMEAFLWKGRCRVIETIQGQTSSVVVRLEDSNTGELFAQSPFDLSGRSVEPVLDSSRYFALRVLDLTTGRSAFLGLGFRERTEAFDFQVALQDWQKSAIIYSKVCGPWDRLINEHFLASYRRQRAPKLDFESDSTTSSSAVTSHQVPTGPKRDFSLKEGQTISVKLGSSNGSSSATTKKAMPSSGGSGGSIPLLAPPPSVKKR